MRSVDRKIWILFVLTSGITVVVAAIFLNFPQIDISVSRYFYVEGEGFPLKHHPQLMWIRKGFKLLFGVVCIGVLLMLARSFIAGKSAGVSKRIWLFCTAAIVLGPGVLVNLIFKNNWGRARPSHIAEFGGDATFSLPLVISDQCAKNCSFVSGETSSIATLSLLGCIVLWNSVSRAARGALLLGATSMTLLASALRIVKGRHFLSDTIFAILFCTLLILLLYHLFDIGRARKNFLAGGKNGATKE